MKKALITGITGQDGSYLSELLLEKGYQVHGLIRRSSSKGNMERIKHIESNLYLHTGDITDSNFLQSLVNKIQPDEVYNLAAQSHVGESFISPLYTTEVDGLGTIRLLEAIRQSGKKETKFYQASTSELYGLVQEVPQKETTPFYPRSPYGVAKLMSFWAVKNYREAYNMFACNGILFNHESPRRGEEFVTRKITKGLVDIIKNRKDCIFIGNLEARRDWGHAKDYVEGMWRILQHSIPDDFVLATGETHSVREWIEECMKNVNMKIEWEGTGVHEVGKIDGRIVIKIDPKFYRPSEVDLLVGDASKAENTLLWKAQYKFKDLVKEMMEEELDA